MQNNNFHLNKNSKLREYLQGDNLNLIGTIYGFNRNFKYLNEMFDDKTLDSSRRWFAVLLYFDHLTGQIERYAVNTNDPNSDPQLLAKVYRENKEDIKTNTKAVDKIFLHSFLRNLVKTYWTPNAKSYNNPRVEIVNYNDQILRNFTASSPDPLATKERLYLIDPKDIKSPKICIPKTFASSKNLKSSLLNIGLDPLIVKGHKDYPKVILDLKSMINSRLLKTEIEVAYNIMKFNSITRIKTEMGILDL